MVEDKLRESLVVDCIHLTEAERLARLREFYGYDEQFYKGE